MLRATPVEHTQPAVSTSSIFGNTTRNVAKRSEKHFMSRHRWKMKAQLSNCVTKRNNLLPVLVWVTRSQFASAVGQAGEATEGEKYLAFAMPCWVVVLLLLPFIIIGGYIISSRAHWSNGAVRLAKRLTCGDPSSSSQTRGLVLQRIFTSVLYCIILRHSAAWLPVPLSVLPAYWGVLASARYVNASHGSGCRLCTKAVAGGRRKHRV